MNQIIEIMKNVKSESQLLESRKIILDKIKSKMASNKNISSKGDKPIDIASNGELYAYPEIIKGIDKKEKAFRTNMRKKLDTYYSKIVASRNSNNNLVEDLESFKEDYFNFWTLNDFKIESFTNRRDTDKKSNLSNMKELLSALMDYIEVSK